MQNSSRRVAGRKCRHGSKLIGYWLLTLCRCEYNDSAAVRGENQRGTGLRVTHGSISRRLHNITGNIFWKPMNSKAVNSQALPHQKNIQHIIAIVINNHATKKFDWRFMNFLNFHQAWAPFVWNRCSDEMICWLIKDHAVFYKEGRICAMWRLSMQSVGPRSGDSRYRIFISLS